MPRLFEKQCTKCKQVKPIAQFPRHTSHQFKVSNWCDVCYQKMKDLSKANAENRRIWREQMDTDIANRTERGMTFMQRRMHNAAKHRAKYFGWEFSIKKEDINIPTHCPILGIPLIKGKGSLTPNSPTLDRIDSSKGYIPGNVMVISNKANHTKSNATLEDLRKIMAWMEVSGSV